jgi:protein-histidine pros-kinase
VSTEHRVVRRRLAVDDLLKAADPEPTDDAHKQREQRLFRSLLEAAPDAMVILEKGGRIWLVNARAEELLGYDRDELVGQSALMLLPERQLARIEELRVQAKSGPSPYRLGVAGDLSALRKDGREVPVELALAPLETDDGLLYSVAVRDISERQRLQEEADRVKDEFFATVSHELRTPLTSLLGYCELMADLEQLTPQGERFLQVITRSAERELRLVDDLLTLVQIEESGLSVRRTAVDVEQVVREAVEAARPRAEEIGIDLTLQIPGSVVQVVGDSDRIGQAMDNLLSNALKFTPAGGSVQVRLRVSHGQAEVDVADSGLGIGDEPHRVFERLYRSGSAVARQVPGAGLGLTIVLAIVEAHGGTIDVVRSDSTGTTFRMTLPLAG